MNDIDKKKRILVVDDETILVEEIKIRLEHNNYEVIQNSVNPSFLHISNRK